MQSENFLKKSSARRAAPLQSGVRYVVQPLAGHQFGEEAACGDQLVIGPVLDDPSMIEHEPELEALLDEAENEYCAELSDDDLAQVSAAGEAKRIKRRGTDEDGAV